MSVSPLPPVRLEAGWYWYHYLRGDQQAQWDAYAAANRATLKIRKQFPGDTSRAIVVVFELLAPIAWPLSGVPSHAPKKGATELKDLSSSQQVKASPDLQTLIAEAGNTAQSATSALQVLIWGGAAVLLYNFFRRTAPAPATED